MYECSSELAQQFGHSNRIMYALTGCGQKQGKSEVVGATDPGPRATGGAAGNGSATTRAAARAAHRPTRILVAFTFISENIFTIVFVAIFLAGFLHRRKKRRHSSE